MDAIIRGVTSSFGQACRRNQNFTPGGATVNAVSRNGMQPIHLMLKAVTLVRLIFYWTMSRALFRRLSRAKTSHNRWEPLSFAAKEGNLVVCTA